MCSSDDYKYTILRIGHISDGLVLNYQNESKHFPTVLRTLETFRAAESLTLLIVSINYHDKFDSSTAFENLINPLKEIRCTGQYFIVAEVNIYKIFIKPCI